MWKKPFTFLVSCVFIFIFPFPGLAHSIASPVHLSYGDCTELTQPNTLIYIYPLDNCDYHCQQSFSLYKALAREQQYQKEWEFFVKKALPTSPIALAQYSSGDGWLVCDTIITKVPVIWLNDAAGRRITLADAEELSYFLQQQTKKSGTERK